VFWRRTFDLRAALEAGQRLDMASIRVKPVGVTETPLV